MIFKPVFSPIIILAIMALLIAIAIILYSKRRWQRGNLVRRIAIILLTALVLLRPMVANGSTVKQDTNINVFFAVDVTGSMVAKDSDEGTMRRFEKVKSDIEYIAKKMSGSRFALIVEDATTYVSVPVTDNIDIILNAVNGLRPYSTSYSAGSSTISLISQAEKTISDYRIRHPERQNLLFYFSDGEDTDSDPDGKTILKQLKSNLVGGAIFGYGSKDGSKIEEIDYYGVIQKDYIRYSASSSSSSHEYISKINEPRLQEIATALNISYYNANDSDPSENDFSQLISNLKNVDDGYMRSYDDLYWVFSLFALGILFWEFYIVLLKILNERKVLK